MKRILLADDDEGLRAMTAEILGLAGFEVDTARDGAEAWERLSARTYDALVTDLNMPVMDGLELTRKIRTDPRRASLPILMLTVRDLVIDQLEGYERGADDYMAKPFDETMLVARVGALIRRAGGPPPIRP